jgi:hypothetical protein
MQHNHSSRIPAYLLGAVLAVRFLLALTDWSAAMMAFHAPHLYEVYGQALDRLYPVRLWVMVPFGVALGWWLYQYHRDLVGLFPGYPISPWGAVARAMIPIYHYWGFWNTWDTAQKVFDAAGRPRPRLSLRTALIMYYVVWLGLGLVKRSPAVREWLWLYVTNEVLDVAMSFAILVAATGALKSVRPEQEQAAGPSGLAL